MSIFRPKIWSYLTSAGQSPDRGRPNQPQILVKTKADATPAPNPPPKPQMGSKMGSFFGSFLTTPKTTPKWVILTHFGVVPDPSPRVNFYPGMIIFD